jgi:hypothetical protein
MGVALQESISVLHVGASEFAFGVGTLEEAASARAFGTGTGMGSHFSTGSRSDDE